MELRHLKYFVAVVEEGSLTVAAEKRLHVAQPSLSRQIRDLEYEVGVPLLTRSVRGIEVTPSGQAFLEHARLALIESEAAVKAAQKAAQVAKPSFALGFLTGQEMEWLPEAMNLLKDELANIDVTVSSNYSPLLADGLIRGRLDLAFMRREPAVPGLEYRTIASEPLVVVMPSDHPLASRDSVNVLDLREETFLGMSNTAPALQMVIDEFFRLSGVDIKPAQRVDNLAMALSMVASMRAVTLLPSYAKGFLPWSVASRPLSGESPTIDLVVGYKKTNSSPTLRLFLSRIDQFISSCQTKASAD
jgi:LysR family hca operon transcriptional activator